MTYVTYEDLGAAVAAADALERRTAHPLVWVNDEARNSWAGWVAAIPQPATVGVHGNLTHGDTAMLTLPLVRLDPACAAMSVGEVFCTDAAWDRWMNACGEQVAALRTSVANAYSYPEYADKMSKARPTEAQRDALTLRATDLRNCATWRVAGGDTTDAPYEWLRDITLGDLCGADGRLEPMARLLYALEGYMSHAGRNVPLFRRACDMLVDAAMAREKVTTFDSMEERAVAVLNLLRSTTVPPELRVLQHIGAHRQRSTRLEFTSSLHDKQHTRLLTERLLTASTLHPSVRALLGVSEDGTTSPIDAAAGAQLLADVAVRGRLTSDAAAPFGLSALRALAAATGYLLDVLSTEPWASRSPAERAEHVINALVAAAVSSSIATTISAAAGGGSSSGGGGGGGSGHGGSGATGELTGAGAIPKHYREHVEPAKNASGYRAVKAAILLRLAKQDGDSQMDALQYAATGILVNAETGQAEPRRWVPLIAFIAMGGEKAVQADLVDPELTELGVAAQCLWPELLGRTVGRTISADKTTLHQHLLGFQLPTLASSIGSVDWTGLDLGGAYRAAQHALRAGTSAGEDRPAPEGLPYSTLADIEDALEVAAPIMTLAGYPGTGEGTIPHALGQVKNTWRVYGQGHAQARSSSPGQARQQDVARRDGRHGRGARAPAG